MANKYRWSATPAHIQFKATDESGFELWFKNEPKIKYDSFWSDDTDLTNGCEAMHHPSEYKYDWRDSLEQRPQEHSHE